MPPLFGLWGVLAGTAIAIVVGLAVLLARFHKFYGVRGAQYFKSVGPPAAFAALAGAPIVMWELAGLTPVAERIPAFALTSASLAVYVGIYWPAASASGMLPERLSLSRLRRRGLVRA